MIVRGHADALFYRPDRQLRTPPAKYGLEAEDIWFAAPDGPRLHGWWVAAHGPSVGTIVYCHGNHANLTHHVRFVQWLPARGFNLLMFDYRGYGQSEGHPTRQGTVDDTLAAIDHALARDPTRTVVFGHSLGGALAVVAVAQRPAVRALAVESTFSSYRRMAECTAPGFAFLVPWLVSDGLDPLDVVADLSPRPLLVIHGTEDHIAPFELGRELFAEAAEPKTFKIVQSGGHATPWLLEREAFETELTSFFSAALR